MITYHFHTKDTLNCCMFCVMSESAKLLLLGATSPGQGVSHVLHAQTVGHLPLSNLVCLTVALCYFNGKMAWQHICLFVRHCFRA